MLLSGKKAGATRLAGMAGPPWVTQRAGRWALQAFMGYLRFDEEDPLWVSKVLVGRTGEPIRQVGKGGKWEVKGRGKGKGRLGTRLLNIIGLLRLPVRVGGRSVAYNSWDRRRGREGRANWTRESRHSFSHLPGGRRRRKCHATNEQEYVCEE